MSPTVRELKVLLQRLVTVGKLLQQAQLRQHRPTAEPTVQPPATPTKEE